MPKQMKELLYSIVTFILVDAAWIGLVAGPTYKKYLPKDLMLETPKLGYAGLFYLIFVVSLWYLIIKDHVSAELTMTLTKAFVFGAAAYATYSFTNMSIIKGWSLLVAVLDIAWGGVLAVIVTWVVISLTK